MLESTKNRTAPARAKGVIDAAWLRQVCLEAGADDVAFVDLDDPALGEERAQVARAFPPTRSLISFVLRMNRENVRSPARSIANSEFHDSTDETNHVARRITGAETAAVTIAISQGAIAITEGHTGQADLRVTADSATWLGFLAKEKSLPWALLARRIRLRGNPKWLLAFGRCFPS